MERGSPIHRYRKDGIYQAAGHRYVLKDDIVYARENGAN